MVVPREAEQPLGRHIDAVPSYLRFVDHSRVQHFMVPGIVDGDVRLVQRVQHPPASG